MKTFLIIVHYGSIDVTVDCLRSVYSDIKAPPALVINNSLDKRLNEKLKNFKNVDLITPHTNLGFAGANNLAMKKALLQGADYIFLLNNDTLVPEGFFQKLINYAANSDDSLISPKIYFAKGFEYHKDKYEKKDLGRVLWYAGGLIDWDNVYASHRGVDEVDKGQYDKITDTDFATGCAVLIKKELIKKIGLMNEKYFVYFEDVDYSVIARKNGFSIGYYPLAYIYHKNAGSSQGPGSPLHRYYQTRNRLYFGFRFASLKTRFALFRESISHLHKDSIVRKAVVDFYLGRLGKRDL